MLKPLPKVFNYNPKCNPRNTQGSALQAVILIQRYLEMNFSFKGCKVITDTYSYRTRFICCHNKPNLKCPRFALRIRCFFSKRNKSEHTSGISHILLNLTSFQLQSRITCLVWPKFKLSAKKEKSTYQISSNV